MFGQLRECVHEPPAGQAYIRLGRKDRSQTSVALLITGVGRLGNSIVQVLNCVFLANQLSAKTILFHEFNAIGNRMVQLSSSTALRRLSIFPRRGFTPPDKIWRTYAMTNFDVFPEPCDGQYSSVRGELVGGFGFGPRRPTKESEGILTIYLRSGDIFSGPSEPDYGQPPWVFYEKILEFRKWTAVEIVSEDEANPNFRLISKWCSKHNIAFMSKGAELAEAVSAVLNASNLVSARGTFVPSLVYLSEGPKTIFQFHDERSPLLCREDIELWTVEDLAGNYVSKVLSGNWKNSQEQRALMVSYPRESLSDVRRD